MLESGELFKESVDHGVHVKITKIALLIAISRPTFCWRSSYYSVFFFFLYSSVLELVEQAVMRRSVKPHCQVVSRGVGWNCFSVKNLDIWCYECSGLESWNAASIETIINRSRKAGIIILSQALAPTVGSDLFKELNKKVSRLREINPAEYEM